MRETTAELQQRFNVTKLTNDTIANSTDNARITMQLFETTDPDGNNFDISVNGYEQFRPDRDGTKKVRSETV